MRTVSAFVSAVHIFALTIGLPSVYFRGRTLKRSLDAEAFRRLFLADSLWGVAAFLWISTGLLRAFGGLEKGSAFYLASPLFWTKLGLFAVILALEAWPMVVFIRWRAERRRGTMPDTSSARTLYILNHVEMAVVVVMVFVASFMARGFGLR